MNLEYARRFAGDLMRRFPQADDYPFHSWCYAQGFYLWGFIHLYEKTGDQALYDYVKAYGEKHVTEDGFIPRFRGNSLDDIMAGSVIVWLYRQTGEEKYRKAATQVRRAFDDYPRNPDGGFWHARGLEGEMWVDGLFMGLMFLARYGQIVDDREYCFNETVHQLNTVFARCRKDQTGLLYHAYSANGRQEWASRLNGCSPEVWSEGLGWYAMMLAEAAAILPEDWPGRDSVVEQLRLLCEDLLKVQDSGCGLWYQVVDKTKFKKNFHDTSGSAMFTYTLCRARALGVIGSGAEDGENGSAAFIDGRIALAKRGLLSKCVQGMDGVHVLDACNGLGVQRDYDSYVNFPITVDAQEGVAAVLWALTELDA